MSVWCWRKLDKRNCNVYLVFIVQPLFLDQINIKATLKLLQL